MKHVKRPSVEFSRESRTEIFCAVKNRSKINITEFQGSFRDASF